MYHIHQTPWPEMKYLLLSLLLHPFLLHAQQAGTFKDSRDGQIYSTITIGNQTWMAENMPYKISGSNLNQKNPDIKYGRLYTWEQAKKACPKGWHLSSTKDWKNLIAFVETKFGAEKTGGDAWSLAGHHFKTIEGWEDPEFSSNSIGFNALPAGFYSACSKTFDELGTLAAYFIAEETDANAVEALVLHSGGNEILFIPYSKTDGLSCRCVKDLTD